jgi:4-amino-4-deoxy-L-arabinose transferase-like glycosyltransferase
MKPVSGMTPDTWKIEPENTVRRERPAWQSYGVLLLAALFLHVATAGIGYLFNETDGQYGGAAKAMLENGHWLIPENNGIPRLVKPPLLVWLVAAAMEVFGVNAFAARLPGGLAVVAWVLVTARIGEIWGGRRRGMLAGGILATLLGSFTLARIVMPEPVFSAAIAAAIWCVLEAHGAGGVRARRLWVIGAWGVAGLAAFVKGPHGPLYVIVAAGAACIFSRGFTNLRLRDLFPPWGLVLALAINLPWYLAVENRFPGFLQNLLRVEMLGHVSGSGAPATDYTAVPRWQFLALHMAWFFPWSVAILVGLAFQARRLRTWRMTGFPVRLIFAWGALVLVSVLMAGQRQDYYAMAAWPVFALLAARVIEGASPMVPARFVGILLLCGLPAVWLAAHAASGRTDALAERSTAAGTLAGFGSDVWTGLLGIAVATLVPAAVAALCTRRSYLPLMTAGAILGVGAVFATARIAPYFSIAPIASEVEKAAAETGAVYFDGNIDTGSSLLFYTNLQVILVDIDPQSDFAVRTQGIGLSNFTTSSQLAALWKTGKPVALITESSKLDEWQKAFDAVPVVRAHCGTLALITNQPPAQGDPP